MAKGRGPGGHSHPPEGRGGGKLGIPENEENEENEEEEAGLGERGGKGILAGHAGQRQLPLGSPRRL